MTTITTTATTNKNNYKKDATTQKKPLQQPLHGDDGFDVLFLAYNSNKIFASC